VILALQSERYSTTGSISAGGVIDLLGKPNLSPLELVIRESVQNSWDARMNKDGGFADPPPVDFVVNYRRLHDAESDVLHAEVFKELPHCTSSRLQIEGSLSDGATVLELADFGTIGLGGPVSPADPPGDRPTDFVDFVRNLGSPRDTHLGGGTYGYGKSSLYRLSRCSTILIDTWSHVDSERRLIACHLGDRFDVETGPSRGRYTGRHWWGGVDGCPVTGAAAEAIARRLGLPPRGPCRTGTTICIIDPDIPETGEDDKPLPPPGDRIHALLLWHFWPKMLAGPDGRAAMNFSVFEGSFENPVFDPADVPPLDLYVAAMRILKSGHGHELRCLRPKKTVGRLALSSRSFKPRLPGFEERFSGPAASVALMRPAELVVKYLPVSTAVPEDQEWAGVFICAEEEEVERAFAESEPPAHDNWVPTNLPPNSREKRFVNAAFRGWKKVCQERFRSLPDNEDETGLDGGGLGLLSRTLGQALATAEGGDPGHRSKARRPRSSRPPRARAAVSLVGLRREGVMAVSSWKVDLSSFPSGPLRVEAAPTFLLVRGNTKSLSGLSDPEVVGWWIDGAPSPAAGGLINLSDRPQSLTVDVRCAAEFGVRVAVTATPPEEAAE